MNDILTGTIEHSDMALYILNSYAKKQHKRQCLTKSQDFKDIRERVQALCPLVHNLDFPETMERLPVVLKDHLQNRPGCDYKIEWFNQGGYIITTSPDYLKKYYVNREGDRNLYGKLTDTLGLSDHTIGYKLWVESLARPGQVIFYEGLSLNMTSTQQNLITVSMISIVFDCDHVITLTMC